jgi:hypothetical protein
VLLGSLGLYAEHSLAGSLLLLVAVKSTLTEGEVTLRLTVGQSVRGIEPTVGHATRY